MNTVNHVTRYLAMIVVTLVITFFTPITHAEPAPTPETEDKTLGQKAKEKAAGARDKVVDKLKGSSNATLNKVGNMWGEGVEVKKCKPSAQGAVATFDAAWQKAFNDPSDLVLPGGGVSWFTAFWIYLLILHLALLLMRGYKDKQGKVRKWLFVVVPLGALFLFLEVRVAMWGDEIKPQLTQIQAEFEQECPNFKGQIVEVATHKTWRAKVWDGTKSVWNWGKSWVVEPEEEPEEDLGMIKRWTYGDVRTIAFEENRDPSWYFQPWVGMLIALAFAGVYHQKVKGFVVRLRHPGSLLPFVFGRETPIPTPSIPTPVSTANPVVIGTPAVTPAPQAQATQAAATTALPQAAPDASQDGEEELVPVYAIWDQL